VEDETFERIPWEHLSAEKPGGPRLPTRSSLYVILAAIALAGVAFLAFSRDPGAPPPSPSSTVLIATATSETTTASSLVLAEADLRAVPEATDEVRAWAEWLSELYFTTDGSGSTELVNLLPQGSPLPLPVPEERVFVESARAISVSEEGDGFRVVVLVRLLGAVGESPYERIPDLALAWTLEWSPDGWVVVDLPERVDLPRLQAGTATALGDVPEPVHTAAVAEGRVIGGNMVGDLWKVVLTIEDQWGGTWPVVAWFTPDGSPVAPPPTAFG
jgi:hypothetical protein